MLTRLCTTYFKKALFFSSRVYFTISVSIETCTLETRMFRSVQFLLWLCCAPKLVLHLERLKSFGHRKELAFICCCRSQKLAFSSLFHSFARHELEYYLEAPPGCDVSCYHHKLPFSHICPNDFWAWHHPSLCLYYCNILQPLGLVLLLFHQCPLPCHPKLSTYLVAISKLLIPAFWEDFTA